MIILLHISKKIKYSIVLFGLVFLTIYQGVKKEYRQSAWETNLSTADKLAVLSELITFDSFTGLFESKLEDNESFILTINRLNQGWQTGMVYDHVPSIVPFENGKDLANDIFSSIMPRFLWPNKRMVNDPERFSYYTGYELNEITSMSIGVLGDFYVNFNFGGSLIALYLFGLFLALLVKWFYIKFVSNDLINLVWLPFIFSYLIRPGNEFYMVLNHIIKALIIFYLIRKFLYPYIYNRIVKEDYSIETR